MSNKTYQIQAGDQLLKIAVEQSVNYFELLELNPAYQANPNRIYPGQTLILPSTEEAEPEAEPKTKIDDPADIVFEKEGCVKGKPACQGMDVCDVLIYSDDSPESYVVLDEKQQKLVIEEADKMATLATEFLQLTRSAPEDKSADKKSIEAYKLKKQHWLERSCQSGLFDFKVPPKPTDKKAQAPTTAEIRNKITNLTQRKTILKNYYSDGWVFSDEDSVKELKDKLIASINSDIDELETLYKKEESNANAHAQPVKQDNVQDPSVKRSFKAGFREAVLLSQNKTIYIRTAFIEKQSKSWKSASSSSVKAALASKKDMKTIVGAMLSDIKKDIVKDATAKKFNELEGVLYSNPLLDKKYKKWSFAADSAKDSTEDARFAVSGEAQLMRFCFHTDVKSVVNKSKGKVDLGVSAGAEMSLLEGKIEASAFLPYQRGYHLYITYKDANGKDANYPFGQFRANVKVLMSCFVGATATAGVTASAGKIDLKEQSSGVTALLDTQLKLDVPNAKTATGAAVTLQGSGFAGAQAGGEVSGALEWEAPDKIGQQKFDALAEVKASGNVALGAGIGAEFRLELTVTTFTLYCKASLVFGPGGSGGFGTTIGFDKIWPLAKVIWGALAVVDYRTLQCIDEEAYNFLSSAAYYFFTVPNQALEGVINGGAEAIDEWWIEQKSVLVDRELRSEQALQIADTIIKGGGKYSGVDQNQLPPETIGMLLDTLVQTFYWNQEEDQEKAIVILLTGSIGRSWRKFEEVLAHMNPTGEKKSGDKGLFDNLNRINAILDGDQQDHFNDWVSWVANGQDDVVHRDKLAFAPFKGTAFANKLPLVEQQINNLPSFYA
jgi:LysM repeat protein